VTVYQEKFAVIEFTASNMYGAHESTYVSLKQVVTCIRTHYMEKVKMTIIKT